MQQALIMAGGSGTRFWPLSRKRLPKQFLSLYGEKSLLQQAAERIEGVVGAGGVHVFTNQANVAKTREQLPQLAAGQIVGEPCGRDTAACIGMAAALFEQANPNSSMIVLAADHVITPVEAFHKAVRTAFAFLEKHPEALLTFGIPPTRPATGYGYLRRDQLVETNDGVRVFKVRSFHEKPDLDTAKTFVAGGDFYWNAGIFCWKASTILQEIERHLPVLRRGVDEIADAWRGPNQKAVFIDKFPELPKISIDYAVMERAENVYVVEAPFQWDDVGSWLALERLAGAKDGSGNVIRAFHRGIRTAHSVVVGEKDHLIATLGIKDLIIVHTADVTLVATRDEEQNVKQLLAQLEEESMDSLL